MEQQRPLRLGDLVDDYCPRERRVTNHAIVAIVEDAIRKTRCTACEAEHVYKGGKAPVRRKKDEKAVLYDQVLADVTAGHVAAAPTQAVAPAAVAPEPPVIIAAPVAVVAAPAVAPIAPVVAVAEASPEEPEPVAPRIDEGWSLNRPLIRASLPRNDSQPPTPRAIPEFTMHQRNVRGSQQFRGGGGQGGHGGGWQDRGAGPNGNSGGYRGGFRPEGQGDGQPGAPNGQRPGGGRRRRRHKSPRPQN